MAENKGHKNVIPYIIPPGETRNPNGRPKGTYGMARLIREELKKEGSITIKGEIIDENGKGTKKYVTIRAKIPTLQKIVLTVIKKAGRGNLKAFEILRDTMEGKPRQTIGVPDENIPVLFGNGQEADIGKITKDIERLQNLLDKKKNGDGENQNK